MSPNACPPCPRFIHRPHKGGGDAPRCCCRKMTTPCKPITHHSPRRPRGLAARYRARNPPFCARTARGGSIGANVPVDGALETSINATAWILAGAGHGARRFENQWSTSGTNAETLQNGGVRAYRERAGNSRNSALCVSPHLSPNADPNTVWHYRIPNAAQIATSNACATPVLRGTRADPPHEVDELLARRTFPADHRLNIHSDTGRQLSWPPAA